MSELDQLLSEWHAWAKLERYVADVGTSSAFRHSVTPNHWDNMSTVIDDKLHDSTMRCVDFEIGEMKDPHRASIYIYARNLNSVSKIWSSPNLPNDAQRCSEITSEAKIQLKQRLARAGVMGYCKA